MNSVGIIGFGRFGKVLANILQRGFAIKAYDPKPAGPFPGVQFLDLDTVLNEKVVFIAVPIRHFESVIADISTKLKKETTLIDVCSVKSYPVNIMLKILPDHIAVSYTHLTLPTTPYV